MESPTYLELNLWSIIGVVVSLVGLGIAIWQIRKVRLTTDALNDTYKSAIRTIENREVISTISALLQRVETLKVKIREDRGHELAQDLSHVAKMLVSLQGSLVATGHDFDLLPYRDLCNSLEVRTLSIQPAELGRSSLSSQFLELTKLEQLLTQIHSNVRYGNERKENVP